MIAVAIIVIVLVIFFIGKKSGKKSAPKPVDLPPDTQPGGITQFNPGPYTDNLHEDITEIWGFRNSKPYSDLLSLSNTQVVAVYNDWNNRYYSEDNETLYQAIAAERFYTFTLGWPALRQTVLDRLWSLGLS